MMVTRGHLDGVRPHPEALCAGAVRRGDPEAPGALPEELVEDVALPLPGPPAHGDDPHGALVARQDPHGFLPDLKLLRVVVVADELHWAGGSAAVAAVRRLRSVPFGRALWLICCDRWLWWLRGGFLEASSSAMLSELLLMNAAADAAASSSLAA